LLVYPWEASYKEDASDATHKLSSTIFNLLSIPKPAVGAPLAAIRPTRRHAALWVFLTTNLPVEAMDTLLRQQYWTTPSITFIVIPFAPLISMYICMIENLTYVESDTEAVLDLVKTTIDKHQQVAWLNTELNTYHDILQSMHIKPLRIGVPARLKGGMKLVWNLYADPPSQSPSDQREWRNVISSLTFLTALYRAGVTRSIEMSCTGCKSIDHPRGLCPTPPILGLSTTSTTTPDDIPMSLNQVHPNTSKGRGQRGSRAQRGVTRVRGRVTRF
jgi:hypothetical protein